MEDVTQLLTDWSRGDEGAADKLFPLVYPELRRMAAIRMSRERTGHTLQPTALVNEAFLKLCAQNRITWQNREHFFGLAARFMRRVLINHAETRGAAKRGGGALNVPLEDGAGISMQRSEELLALDAALTELAGVDERQSRIVELRYFAGLSVEDVGNILGISTATVKREWRVARAWLAAFLRSDAGVVPTT